MPGSDCVEAWPDAPKRPLPPVAERCPGEDAPAPELALGAVRFPELKTGEDTLEVGVEIAAADPARQRGLMFRKSMAENAGMLFIFEEQRRLTFWMKNTCIPLDMVFIDDAGIIVGIEENTPTLSEQTFGPRCPARYVLEVNAGYARAHGLRPGLRVELPKG